MKQIIQNYSTGKLELAEVPIPLASSNKVLVKNCASLISMGTERSIIELGRKSLLGKAKARPDLLKRFIEKSKKEGFLKTFKEALARLDNPTALGYSSAGIVVEVGGNISKFSPGDRVACIGAGYASHADYITVPENLCCKIPDDVTFEEASFGMLGIIALHGVRTARLSFGTRVGVIGLGLLGLLTVQILKAYGCIVIGMDIDPAKVALADKLGADSGSTSPDDFSKKVDCLTDGHGADAVIITAATESSTPVDTAIRVAGYGGRIVLVGVADIHPHRNEMWHKEVEIIVSKAGGPGILDPLYENKGIDYPIGYVRWTENRNLIEFIRLLSQKQVNIHSLISHRFPVDKAEEVYERVLGNKGGPYVGVILEYPNDEKYLDICSRRTIQLSQYGEAHAKSDACVGVIGAGLFGKSVLLPALKRIAKAKLSTIATSSSPNSYHTAKKYAFQKCTTNYKDLLESPDIDSVLILTPHSTHARMVIESLKAEKNVFVEKPLCVSISELEEIIRTYEETGAKNALKLMVGYNRRFSPHALKIAEYLANRKDPMVITYRVNAGFVPPDHWVHAEEQGGGRIIGEICHFIDFVQFLTGSSPTRVFGERISGNNRTALNNDNLVVTLKCADGSVGNILYSASGDKAFSRERIEIFCEGKSIVSADFRETNCYFEGKRHSFKTASQSMGYTEELEHFFEGPCGSQGMDLNDIFYSTATVFAIHESLDKGFPVNISLPST